MRLIPVRSRGFQNLEFPVLDLQAELALPELQARHCTSDVIMLYKLLNDLVDCPELTGAIDLCVPSRIHSMDVFVRMHLDTNYDFHSPIARMLRLGNTI